MQVADPVRPNPRSRQWKPRTRTTASRPRNLAAVGAALLAFLAGWCVWTAADSPKSHDSQTNHHKTVAQSPIVRVQGENLTREIAELAEAPIASEVRVTYTYEEPYGLAEATHIFDAAETVLLPGDREALAEDLLPGEQIQLEDGVIGTVKDVRLIPVGERAPPSSVSDPENFRRVVGTIKHIANTVVNLAVGGETITATPDHPFWVANRNDWIPAGDLRPGDLLVSADGSAIPVESVAAPRHGEFTVYNLEVEGLHTYHAGNSQVLVHNGPATCARNVVHGNSLASRVPTTLYRLVDKSTGRVLKYGITNNPAGRYTQAFLNAHNAILEPLVVGSRRYVRELEIALNTKFRSSLPLVQRP